MNRSGFCYVPENSRNATISYLRVLTKNFQPGTLNEVIRGTLISVTCENISHRYALRPTRSRLEFRSRRTPVMTLQNSVKYLKDQKCLTLISTYTFKRTRVTIQLTILNPVMWTVQIVNSPGSLVPPSGICIMCHMPTANCNYIVTCYHVLCSECMYSLFENVVQNCPNCNEEILRVIQFA